MKWIIPGALAAVLAGCGWSTANVVEYQSVSVSPVVSATTVVRDACGNVSCRTTRICSPCGSCGTCGNGGFFGNSYGSYDIGYTNYDYNFDYDYNDSPIDVSTTTVEVY